MSHHLISPPMGREAEAQLSSCKVVSAYCVTAGVSFELWNYPDRECKVCRCELSFSTVSEMRVI